MGKQFLFPTNAATGSAQTLCIEPDGTVSRGSPVGGGTNVNCGHAVVDFGAFGSNKSQAETVITGQAGITSSSKIWAQIRCVDSADHSEDEHLIENIEFKIARIVDGTGFTIFAFKKGTLQEQDTFSFGQWNVTWFWI